MQKSSSSLNLSTSRRYSFTRCVCHEPSSCLILLPRRDASIYVTVLSSQLDISQFCQLVTKYDPRFRKLISSSSALMFISNLLAPSVQSSCSYRRSSASVIDLLTMPLNLSMTIRMPYSCTTLSSFS